MQQSNQNDPEKSVYVTITNQQMLEKCIKHKDELKISKILEYYHFTKAVYTLLHPQTPDHYGYATCTKEIIKKIHKAVDVHFLDIHRKLFSNIAKSSALTKLKAAQLSNDLKNNIDITKHISNVSICAYKRYIAIMNDNAVDMFERFTLMHELNQKLISANCPSNDENMKTIEEFFSETSSKSGVSSIKLPDDISNCRHTEDGVGAGNYHENQQYFRQKNTIT